MNRPRRIRKVQSKSDSFGLSVMDARSPLKITTMPRRSDRDLRMSFIVSKTATTGTTLLFLVNSAYDLGQAESAKQPVYYDIMKLMYSYYTVKSVDYRITAFPTIHQGWFSFTPNTVNSLPSYTLDDISNLPESRVAFTNMYNDTTSTNGAPVAITGHVDMTKWLDYSSVNSLCDSNWTSTSQDPINQVWGILRCSPLDGSSSTTFKFLVEFNMHIRFETPIQVADTTSSSLGQDEKLDYYEPAPVRRSATPRTQPPQCSVLERK